MTAHRCKLNGIALLGVPNQSDGELLEACRAVGSDSGHPCWGSKVECLLSLADSKLWVHPMCINVLCSELPVLGDHILSSFPQKDFSEVRREHITPTWGPEVLAHV